MTGGTLALAGRDVPRIGYGTMRLTGPHIMGPPADRPEAVRVLRRAVELGVRVIDTAWYYGPYEANLVLAEALHPYADDLVIVTKLGGARRPDGSWYSALSAQELREGCEHDLRLLQLDTVPVAHLRWMPGAEIPFEDALATMISLRDEGKIEHLGLSNVSLEQVELALTQTPIVTVSNAYSVLNRTDESLVERCEQAGIAYLPFFPLAASPVQSGAGVTGAGVVADVASRLQVSATQVALAWLLHRSPIMLPIPGTSSVAHLEDNLAAASLQLSREDLAALAAA